VKINVMMMLSRALLYKLKGLCHSASFKAAAAQNIFFSLHFEWRIISCISTSHLILAEDSK
jgi:hypothetical protein